MRFLHPVRMVAVTSAMALGGGLLVAIAGPAAPAVAATTLPGYTALVPVRICDTRAAGPAVVANQCDTSGHSPLGAGGILTVTVAGMFGVPADASSVVLHVTATGTNAGSWFTLWPTGQTPPATSVLNWTPGQTVPNETETDVGTLGRVSLANAAGTADVVIDLEGYVKPATGGLFVPLPPTRVCDTRLGAAANACNAGGSAAGTLGPNQSKVVNVATGFGVPAGATAVVLNLTATSTTADSWFTTWPDGSPAPLASSLNWSAGQTVPNRVMTPISATGNIDVFNARGNADMVIDLEGYYSPTAVGGSGFFGIAPIRLCDTRPVGPGVASNGCNATGSAVGPHDGFSLGPLTPITTAAVVNVTVTNTADSGFLTVFPDDAANLPLASDLNWSPGQTIANFTVADLGSTATLALFNGSRGSTDVVIDLVGFYSTTVPAAAPASNARRPVVMRSSLTHISGNGTG